MSRIHASIFPPTPASRASSGLRATAARLLLPGLALVGMMLSAGTAMALPFSVTTTGTIASGSDPANILGAGTNLAGDPYSLTIQYNGLGPSYFTDGSGNFAQDFGDAILGSVTVSVGPHTKTTVIASNPGPSLLEDTSDIIDSTSGNDAAGNFVYGSQDVGSATNNFVSFADLQTFVEYALAPGDTGLDSYSFSNAANTQTVSFSGTPTSIVLTVPEPATWPLMGCGLLGLGLWRRHAR